MIHFSHDPDAGTLYCYFAELSEGQASVEWEYPAALLLDAQGAVIGIRLDLDDEVTLDQLELALEQDGVALDMETGYLRVLVVDAPPAREVQLDETALLDLDDDGRILGTDLAVPAEYRTAEALARLAPFMIEVEADDEVEVDDEETDQSVDQDDELDDEADDEEEDGDDEDELDDADNEDDAEHESVAAVKQATQEEQSPPRRTEAILPTNAVRAGFVALVGKPNVGKSTLLNQILGQKVAIVSPRPQTTRVPLRGIFNRPDAQIVFIDTPGIHDPRHKLGTFMVEIARRAIPDADVVCFMADITKPPSRLDDRIAAQVRRARSPRVLVLNKVDVRLENGQSHLEQFRALGPWDMEVAVSASKGQGIETLIEEIVQRLPRGPRLYPEDQVSDQTERQLAAELVREKVLLFTDQEIPHAVAVEVDEWNERDNATYIRMTINVEKDSQKGILIGAGGTMLKRIGTAARKDIEASVGHTVFLDLWVKSRHNWRDDPSSLGWLGYKVKDWT